MRPRRYAAAHPAQGSVRDRRQRARLTHALRTALHLETRHNYIVTTLYFKYNVPFDIIMSLLHYSVLVMYSTKNVSKVNDYLKKYIQERKLLFHTLL